jgi:tRNA dimethylallyltransferase
MNPFVLIVGPTASGKSALAFELAREMNGAILNCDSVQTYQRLDIGAAKPSRAEMRAVPHFLFDILKPGEVLTAGIFRAEALKVLERELPNRIVFGVGGSGFYIQALEKGMFDIPRAAESVERAVREENAKFGADHMYEELQRLDPEYAAVVNPNDNYRTLRALVIMRDSGKKVSELKRAFKPQPFPFPLLKMGLLPGREALLPRVEQRTGEMLKAGLLDEVRALVLEGFSEWPALQSVGYREALTYLKGEISLQQLPALIVEKTMQLAKKQRTWFRRETGIHWLGANPLAEARAFLTEQL